MSIRFPKKQSPAVRRPVPGQVEKQVNKQVEAKAGAPVAAKLDGHDKNSGARAALRALALQSKSPEREVKTQGAAAATLGAKLMNAIKGEPGKKAFAALGLGISMLGIVQPASAGAMPVGSVQTDPLALAQADAAKVIQSETGGSFVQVNGSKLALEKMFTQAQAGELDVTNLIINTDGGKLASTYELKDLKQKFPEEFKAVQTVHVVGSNLQNNPFKNYQGEIFENVKGIVSFDLSTTLNQTAASDWLVPQTHKALDDVPAEGLSAQDALIHATTIATKGADAGVRTRVDIEGQTHTQAPENALSEWLDAQQKPVEGSDEQPNITKAELSEKLLELSSSDEGLTDSMLGVLQSRMNQRNFKMDYDAARLGSQLIDVHQNAGAEVAIDALKSGTVHTVRHELATAANADVAYAQARSELFTKEIPRGVPMAGNEAIPTGGLQGQAYLVDGMGTIKNGEVTVQSIHHPAHGDGYQLTFKLGDKAGAELESFLEDQHSTRLVDKTIVNYSPTEDGRVVTAEKTDDVEATGVIENQRPEMSLGPALRFEKEGEFRIDYFAESISKQAVRGEVHVQVFGKDAAQQNERVRDVLEELGLGEVVEGQPSQETEDKLKAFRLLEQADPRAHHALMNQVEAGGEVTIADLHDALIAAEIPPAFLQQAYFAEASPGHLSVIVPGQSEAYARRGVRAVYHTISKPEIFAYIANDGALQSTKDRLQVGKVFRGMSSDTDLRTGGADYVFTRQVNESMGNPSMSSMRGGAIVMKSDVLDRADWYAYSGDKFGTTLTGDRGEPSAEVREIAERSFKALEEAGDPSVKNKDFEPWFEQLIKSQTDSRQNSYLPRAVGTDFVNQTTGSSNETMLEGTIPIDQIESFLVRNEAAKKAVVDKCKELGLEEINGKPVEEFIQVRDKFFTEEQMESFEATPTDKVGTEQDLKDQDNRLQFYVRNSVEPVQAKEHHLA